MSELTKLPNIGKALAKELEACGIKSIDEFKKLGSKKAFIQLSLSDPDSCYNKLCALEGAVQGIRWHHLSNETKADLKTFLEQINV
jgi:DNA transformation protein